MVSGPRDRGRVGEAIAHARQQGEGLGRQVEARRETEQRLTRSISLPVT